LRVSAKTNWIPPRTAKTDDECCGFGITDITMGARLRRIKTEEAAAATSRDIHDAKLGRRQSAEAGMKTAREYPYRQNVVISLTLASSCRRPNHNNKGTPPAKPYIKEDAVTTD